MISMHTPPITFIHGTHELSQRIGPGAPVLVMRREKGNLKSCRRADARSYSNQGAAHVCVDAAFALSSTQWRTSCANTLHRGTLVAASRGVVRCSARR